MPAELTWAPVATWAPSWRHVWLDDPPLHLLVCTQEHDGDLHITHVVVAGEALDATQFISIPMGRIAQLMAITPPSPTPDADLGHIPPAAFTGQELANPWESHDELDEQPTNVATETIYDRKERWFLSDALNSIAYFTPKPIPSSEPWASVEHRVPLTRPPVGPGYDPDEFYQRVGEAYTALILSSNRVANAIAEEANVPVSTARGWIREARRRGHLQPPPRKHV